MARIRPKAALFPRNIVRYLDLAIYVLDARAPYSTFYCEPSIGTQAHFVLSKADLADKEETRRWCELFRELKLEVSVFSRQSRESLGKLRDVLRSHQKAKLEKAKKEQIKDVILRTVVLGMPNVGKSTLINFLVGSKKARTGDRPGITKGFQWIRILAGVDLLDTRGVYEDYARVKKNIPKLTAINVLLPTEMTCIDAVQELISAFKEENWKKFCEYFRLSESVKSMAADELVYEVGRRLFGRRFRDDVLSGVCAKILNMANDGKFSRFTLEKCTDIKHEFRSQVEKILQFTNEKRSTNQSKPV